MLGSNDLDDVFIVATFLLKSRREADQSWSQITIGTTCPEKIRKIARVCTKGLGVEVCITISKVQF